MRRLILAALLIFAIHGIASAQSARAILEQALRSHGRAKVTDITAVGSVTRDGEVKNISLYSNGSTKGRFENGGGGDRQVLIFNNGRAWAGPDTKLRSLNEQTSRRRVTLFPFLDLIDDLNHPHLEIADLFASA